MAAWLLVKSNLVISLVPQPVPSGVFVFHFNFQLQFSIKFVKKIISFSERNARVQMAPWMGRVLKDMECVAYVCAYKVNYNHTKLQISIGIFLRFQKVSTLSSIISAQSQHLFIIFTRPIKKAIFWGAKITKFNFFQFSIQRSKFQDFPLSFHFDLGHF